MSGVRKRRRKRNPAEPRLEIVVRSNLWRQRRGAQALVRKAVAAAAKAVSTAPVELAIVLSHDSAIKALNRDWRGRNAATNVLAFPAGRPAKAGKSGRKASEKTSDKLPAPIPYIGDIVIAYQTTAREAEADGKPFRHHLAHLAVHGFLHLLGYDHESDRDAEKMENLERRILRRLAMPDPYAPQPTAN